MSQGSERGNFSGKAAAKRNNIPHLANSTPGQRNLLEEKLKDICPVYRSKGSSRHLCEQRCYYLHYEPNRKLAELLNQLKATKLWSKACMDGWQAYMHPRECNESEVGQKWMCIFESPSGCQYTSVNAVVESFRNSAHGNDASSNSGEVLHRRRINLHTAYQYIIYIYIYIYIYYIIYIHHMLMPTPSILLL
jgi:hypothetical protein